MKTKLFNVKAEGSQSGNINRISYYEDKEIMEVKFKNGQIYHYEGVSYEKWEEACLSISIGSFMHKAIIGRHKAIKL